MQASYIVYLFISFHSISLLNSNSVIKLSKSDDLDKCLKYQNVLKLHQVVSFCLLCSLHTILLMIFHIYYTLYLTFNCLCHHVLPQTSWWTKAFIGIQSMETFVLEIWGIQGDELLSNLAVDDIEVQYGMCPGKIH